MTALDFNQLIGKGTYTVPEASRLTGVPAQTIRRWLQGYSYTYKGETIAKNAFISHSLPEFGGHLSVTFLEMIEVRFVNLFRKYGVSWNTIRLAAERATEIFQTDHPFTSLKFQTDGRSIFARLGEETGEEKLLNLVRSQWAFKQIVQPGLIKQLEYSESNEDHLLRWWPLGRKRTVVIDPERSFGQPIASKEGVPTTTLASAYEATDSFAEVARWYDVSKVAVRDAVEFERRLHS